MGVVIRLGTEGCQERVEDAQTPYQMGQNQVIDHSFP